MTPLLIITLHPSHPLPWEKVPGGEFLLGVLGGVALYLFCRLLGRLLHRREDYYG